MFVCGFVRLSHLNGETVRRDFLHRNSWRADEWHRLLFIPGKFRDIGKISHNFKLKFMWVEPQVQLVGKKGKNLKQLSQVASHMDAAQIVLSQVCKVGQHGCNYFATSTTTYIIIDYIQILKKYFYSFIYAVKLLKKNISLIKMIIYDIKKNIFFS